MIKPMLATLVEQPFDKKGWYFEVKWDGYRAIAEKEGEEIKLYSRNNQSFLDRFPEVGKALLSTKADVVLDGEIVVLDEKGLPDFQLLQDYHKDQVGDLVYYVFDLIELEGRDLKDMPLKERKDMLQKVLPNTPHIEYGDHVEDRGIEFFEAVKRRGLEGMVAKDANSKYHPGYRSKEWLKFKNRMRQEVVIAGFTKPKGGRKYFGSLILGAFKGTNLEYIGHSGGGFSDDELVTLSEKLNKLTIKKSPFENIPDEEDITWVKPILVCEVEFEEWTKDGVMRQPTFVGLREDKMALEVIREFPEKSEGKYFGGEPPVDEEEKKVRVRVGKQNLLLSHLNKVYWPSDGFTKGDLINYYRSVAKYILPYLKDRPLALLRHPGGITEEGFYQKDIPKTAPEWLETVEIKSDSEGRLIRYAICQNEESLIYLINLGSIDLHSWNSRKHSLDNPDYMIIDLDPELVNFNQVIKTAQVTKQILDKGGLSGYCKTSGIAGLHVYVPLGAKYTHDQSKELAYLIALLVNQRLPEMTSLERDPEKRRGKVYLDYLQNGFGKNTAAPYCVRPVKGASVSTPLDWEEIKEGLSPQEYTIQNVLDRLSDKGDIFKAVLGEGIDMRSAIEKLQD